MEYLGQPFEYGNTMDLASGEGPLFSELMEKVLLNDAYKILGPDTPIEIRLSSDRSKICWTKNPGEPRLKTFPILVRKTNTGGERKR